ncbi:lysophospholipid acyltransferase family protein [bacterium]|nr:lysophospholipid acyltransferase family protein [candidate division CSSED10-310 bacterium]
MIRRFRKWFLNSVAVATLKSLRWYVKNRSFSQVSQTGFHMGNLVFLLSRHNRRIIWENLEIGLGGTLTDQDRYLIAKTVMQNLGRYVMEAMKIQDLSADNVKALVDAKQVKRQLKQTFDTGRSAMIITAHYSNWELFAARLATIAPIKVLARSSDNPEINRMIVSSRNVAGVEVIDRDDRNAARIIRRISKEGGQILGVLMDLDSVRVKSVFAPFLGVPAYTPSGPAVIALKRWMDVYVGFMIHDPVSGYRLELTGPLNIQPSGNLSEDVLQVTTLFNALISDQIRKTPEQWAWIHRRWRRRPEDFQ